MLRAERTGDTQPAPVGLPRCQQHANCLKLVDNPFDWNPSPEV